MNVVIVFVYIWQPSYYKFANQLHLALSGLI